MKKNGGRVPNQRQTRGKGRIWHFVGIGSRREETGAPVRKM